MKKEKPLPSKKQTEPAWYHIDQLPALILIILYSIVDYIPNFKGADVMGAQWVYLCGVHILSGLYLLSFGRRQAQEQLSAITGNMLTLVLLAFLVIAGISMSWAINRVESMVVYSRLLTTVLIFFQVGILLGGRLNLLKPLSVVFAGMVLFQSLEVIQQFYTGINDGTPLDTVISNIKVNTGNKNILAASLAIKFSFSLYVLLASPRWAKLPMSILLIIFIVAIAMVNARSSFVSIAAQVFLAIVFLSIAMIREKNWKQGIESIGWVVVPVVIGFFLSTWILQSAIEMQDKPTGYSTITERAKTITFETSGRNNLWLGVIDYIKKHPVFGAGYGNWKLASIPYEREHIDELFVAYHSHNDFLEMTADTGWTGGLLYISLFAIASFWLLRILLDKNSGKLFKPALGITLGLASYFTDAMFNFPAERPIMQFFLAFVLAAILQLHFEHRKILNRQVANNTSATLLSSYGTCFALALAFAGFFNIKVYQSMRGQYYINQDMLKNEPSLEFDQVNQDLPSIPNLNAFCFPIKLIKARYLMKAKRFPEALEWLEKSRNEAPKLSINEFFTAQCYLALNNKDSAFYYATKAFEYRPRVRNNYIFLNQLLKERKDSMQLEKNFAIARKLRKEPWIWGSFLSSISGIGVNQKRYKDVLDSAIKLFPEDNELKSRVQSQAAVTVRPYFDIAREYFAKRDFKKAITSFKQAQLLNPADYSFDENIGLCYYELKDFRSAITYFDKAIASGKARDAKSFFFKGICQINSGKKEEGCSTLREAASRNYPGASDLIKSNCGN